MLDKLASIGFFSVIVALASAWLAHEYNVLGSPANSAFQRRIERLRAVDYISTYHRYLKLLLHGITKHFGTVKKDGEASIGNIYNSLTERSFGVLFLLSIYYPIVFMYLGWLTGIEGKIGNYLLYDAGYLYERIFSLLLWIGFTLIFLKLFTTLSIAINVLLSTLISAVLTFNVFMFELPTTFIIGEFALCSFIVMYGYLRRSVKNRGRIFTTFYSAACTIIIIQCAFLTIRTVIGASANSQIGLIEFLRNHFSVIVTSCLCMVTLPLLLSNRVITYLALLGFGFLTLWGISLYTQYVPQGLYTSNLTIFLFICLIPLVNVPLDWLSLAITRGLMMSLTRKTPKLDILIWATVDIFFAVFLLFSTAVAFLGSLSLMNYILLSSQSKPLVDILSLLEQIKRGNWGENMWIWFMLVSTLIPTVIHFFSVTLALATTFSDRKKMNHIAETLQKNHESALKFIDSPQDAAHIQADKDAQLLALIHLYAIPLFYLILALTIVILLFIFLLSIVPQWMALVSSYLY